MSENKKNRKARIKKNDDLPLVWNGYSQTTGDMSPDVEWEMKAISENINELGVSRPQIFLIDKEKVRESRSLDREPKVTEISQKKGKTRRKDKKRKKREKRAFAKISETAEQLQEKPDEYSLIFPELSSRVEIIEDVEGSYDIFGDKPNEL